MNTALLVRLGAVSLGVDATHSRALPPAGMAHYAWSVAESVVQINAVRPFDVV